MVFVDVRPVLDTRLTKVRDLCPSRSDTQNFLPFLYFIYSIYLLPISLDSGHRDVVFFTIFFVKPNFPLLSFSLRSPFLFLTVFTIYVSIYKIFIEKKGRKLKEFSVD